MNKRAYLGAITGALALFGATSQAALFGPTTYSSLADSPSEFAAANFAYYYFNDFEGNNVNTPGVTASGNGLCLVGAAGCFAGFNVADSVGNGGDGSVGRSLYAAGFPGITLDFDASVLGSLPTAVGLVWTDGTNNIRFEAFLGATSLGILNGVHADGNFGGTLAEDRFYGVTNAAGISRINIRSGAAGMEIDHLRYGGGQSQPPTSVPEPGTLALLGLGLAGLGFSRRAANRRG